MFKITQFIVKVFFLMLLMSKYTLALEGIEGTISGGCHTPDISRITLVYPNETGSPLRVTWNSSGANVVSYNVYDHNYNDNKKVKPFRTVTTPSFKNNVPPLGKDQSANYDYYFQAVCRDGTVSGVSNKYIATVTTKPKKRVVKCWGKDTYGQVSGISKVPPLTNPKMVSAGRLHTCALADEGVKCWGLDLYGQVSGISKVLPLTNPKMVSAGGDHTCAIADEGIKCWGHDTYRQVSGISKVLPLTHPTMVSAGLNDHTCAIADEGIKCWSLNDTRGKVSGISEVLLTHPTIVSAGGYHTCALADEGIKCWGSDKYGQVSEIPKLTNPTMVSVGRYHTCALADEGIKCWGDDGFGQVINIPALVNPKMVSAGWDHACAISEE